MAVTATATGDDFLKLREQLKQDIRNKHKAQQKNSGAHSLSLSASVVPGDGYGSFFGPSLSSLAPRVIQECKFLHQNPTSVKAKNVRVPPAKSKAEVIKAARDYSFLFSDDIPAPVKPDSTGRKPAREPDKGWSSMKGLEKQSASKNGKLMTKSHGPKSVRTPAQSSGPMQQLASKKQAVGRSVNGPVHSSGPKYPIRYSTTKENLAQARPKNKRSRECVDNEFDQEEFRKIIRGMYRQMRDDHDDRNMEVSFNEIQKEERRSAKIAKKEDEQELQKIIQENKLEMKKKLRK